MLVTRLYKSYNLPLHLKKTAFLAHGYVQNVIIILLHQTAHELLSLSAAAACFTVFSLIVPDSTMASISVFTAIKKTDQTMSKPLEILKK